MSGVDVWGRFAHDPRNERNARLRASDRDRDVVNDVLGVAYADGRLTPDELDERSERVARSKTLGELPAVIDDLVLPATAVPSTAAAGGLYRAEAERRYHRRRLVAQVIFLLPTLICWVVWISVLIGGAGTAIPWPIFPTLGTSIPLLLVLLTRNDMIAGTEHRLEQRDLRRRQRGGQFRPPPPEIPRS